MTGFGWQDYLIFVVYLVASVLVGVVFVREQKNVKDYFLAGKSMGYVVVAISIIAALFSGISYLGAPAETYGHDLSYALVFLSFFIATPVTNLIFMPFFCNLRLYTAYGYFEKRFGVSIRTLASALFIIRVLIWLALATYAPALALKQVTGLPLWVSIVLTGALTTFYTTLGGMKAVIWTDVLQFFVLAGGQVVIFWKALAAVPGGVVGAFEIADAGGKLRCFDLSLDPTIRVTFWGILVGAAFTNLVQMATDQVSVQRYLTTPNLAEAKRSLWLKLALTIPVVATFYLCGTVLYAFYNRPGMAPPDLPKVDYILPYFVVHELPRGMPGLLIAAIYAATMSTISAGINALTTATLVDFYQRFTGRSLEEKRSFDLARWLTFGYGVAVIVLAFVVHRLGTLLEASNKAMGLIGGPLLGIFLLGMLSKRANGPGTAIGWIAGVAVLAFVVCTTQVSFVWYAMVGCLVTMLVGWVAGLFFSPPADEQVRGLVARRGNWPQEPVQTEGPA
jgi:sodium-coupled monocarboxylate transporter 8/12